MTEPPLLPGAYDQQAHTWRICPPSPSAATTLASLTVVTFNIWFGAYGFQERCAAMLHLLEACDADLIALQEVTPASLEQIMRTAWVRRSYTLSDLSGGSVDPYGVLLLSRLPITSWSAYPLPTAMGRQLITATATINNTPLTCAAVHLESTEYSAPTRAKQLARIMPVLEPAPHVIFMGDFNFCSSWEKENEQLDPRYLDLWPVLRPGEDGYTVDTANNRMRWHHTEREKRVRFDRILLRSTNQRWQPQQIRLLGNEPFSVRPVLHPSDHFGLIATFAWQDE